MSSGGSTGDAPTTGAATSGVTATGSGDGSTGSTSSTDFTSSTNSTNPSSVTTGEGSSTGAAARVCLASETVKLAIADQDTGVVPNVGPKPCPWSPSNSPECRPLNFGTTEFYRLINDQDDGRNAALLRFPVTSLDQAVMDLGHEPDDLLGLRIEFVVWEGVAAPANAYTLEIHGLDEQNFGWTEGTKNGVPAADGDSSEECMTRAGGKCTGWGKGSRALDGAISLGLLPVDAPLVAANDKDTEPDQYHALVRSERLEGASALFGGPVPSFAVTLSTPRDFEAEIVGIKLREAPWEDPTLYADLCTMWDS